MSEKTTEKVTKTEAEWREQLTPEQYHVAREAGTERAFTGKYWDNHEDGKYCCVGCGAPLFDSETKFDSGTGWPSFNDPIEGAVETSIDNSYGMVRTEVHCANCGSHLGHFYEDEPKGTGPAYRVNGVALAFKPR